MNGAARKQRARVYKILANQNNELSTDIMYIEDESQCDDSNYENIVDLAFTLRLQT